MTTLRPAPRPLSWAWPFGWLSLSGPVLLSVGNTPGYFGFPLLPWVSMMLDFWCMASVMFGVIAICFAHDDTRPSCEDQPRLAVAGRALGLLGIAISSCLLVLWLLTPLPF